MQLLIPEWIAPVAPDPTVLTGHAVALEGDAIVAVEPVSQALLRFPEAERLELPGHLLIPGLVNLHCHAAMTLLRGVGDDLPLARWLRERIWPLETKLVSPEFVRDGNLLACGEMLLAGITCVNDMYFYPEAMAEAATTFGMRAAVGIIVIEFPSAYASTAGEYLRKGLELRDRLRDDPLVSFCLAPHAPYTVSDASFTRIAELTGELGLPVHCHLHETELEIAESVAQHGVRPLARLARLGLLGPELLAVHAVHLEQSELELLAEHGASVAHCPHSNLKLASGIAPLPQMLSLGINVGIGTDGAASNNRLDLLSEARTAALLAKGVSGDAACWPAAKVLEAMTLGGARALGLADRIGSIEVGKSADLVAIDLGRPETSPVFDPVSHLVYAAGREHVREVWVAGRHVVRKRQLSESDAAARLTEVVGRTRLWHNRISEILPAGP